MAEDRRARHAHEQAVEGGEQDGVAGVGGALREAPARQLGRRRAPPRLGQRGHRGAPERGLLSAVEQRPDPAAVGPAGVGDAVRGEEVRPIGRPRAPGAAEQGAVGHGLRVRRRRGRAVAGHGGVSDVARREPGAREAQAEVVVVEAP